MSAFSIIPAALTGFRLTREQPRALLLWAGVALTVSFVDAAVTIATGAQGAVNRIQAMAGSGAPDLAAIVALIPRLAPALAISTLLGLGLGAVLLASVFRAELGPESGAERRVRVGLGPDEARMALVLAALFGVQLVVAFGVAVLLGLLMAAGGGGSLPALAALSQLAVLAVTGLLMVRLALAPPMALAEPGVRLAEAWRRTRGRFWPLLGALVMAAALAMLVTALANFTFTMLAGAVLVAAGQGIGALKTAFLPSRDGWGALLAPGVIAYRAFGAVAVALVLPILAGPVAAAYKAFGRAA